MFTRSSLRSGRRAAHCLQCAQKRGLAAPASGSFTYQTGDAAGVKIASRDLTGPTTTLALVSRAGTRFQWTPNLSQGLEKFAFKNTERRSALRIVRESELLGAQLMSSHGRENLVIGAKFMRDDLPYFVELLAEVAGMTKFQSHVFAEEVLPQIQLSQKKFLSNTDNVALDTAHSLAFHRGLGYSDKSPSLQKYLNPETIAVYSNAAYSKSNFSIVANGADHSELSKWVGEFFKGYNVVPMEDAPKIESDQTKYYGGEERIAHDAGNTIVLGFPGSSSFTGGFYKPEIQVLASLLGGESSIKWSPSFSLLAKATADLTGLHVKTKSAIYTDAGLLYVLLNGSASNVAKAAHEVVKTIKAVAGGQISKEDVQKAKASAKFKELEFGQVADAAIELTGSGLVHGGKAYQIDETAKAIDGVTEEKVKQAAAELLKQKASVSAVGDLFVLPYAEELGLTV